MTIGEFIQILGAVVSGLVVIYQLLLLIRDWRAGSPELRTISKALDRIQDEQMQMLRRINGKL